MRSAFLLVFCLCFTLGCQSTTTTSKAVEPVFYDGLYPGYENVNLETEQEIFAINQQMKDFVREKLVRNDSADKKVRALVRAIFDHSDLHLLYVNSANTTAVDTFNNKAANCLSLSILTFSLAEYAGLDVTFQEVSIPEYWTMRQGYSLRNGHVNLVIYPETPSDRKVIYGKGRGIEVDFDRSMNSKRLPKQPINRDKVVAMFYNNKGADALVSGDRVTAYAYFRRALQLEPSFGASWVNLGLMYRQDGYLPLAEQSYLQALDINQNDTTALENLAYVYGLSDRKQKADDIRLTLKRKRQSNPNYHFILGEQAYFKDNWQQAIKHYKTAIRLDKKKHEFYFAMAKAYYQLGDVNRSQFYLKRAKKMADERSTEDRYQGKLDMLSRL